MPKLGKFDKALLYHQRVVGLFWCEDRLPSYKDDKFLYTLGFHIYWQFSKSLQDQCYADTDNYISNGGSTMIRDILKVIKYYTFPGFTHHPEWYHYSTEVFQ